MVGDGVKLVVELINDDVNTSIVTNLTTEDEDFDAFEEDKSTDNVDLCMVGVIQKDACIVFKMIIMKIRLGSFLINFWREVKENFFSSFFFPRLCDGRMTDDFVVTSSSNEYQ